MTVEQDRERRMGRIRRFSRLMGAGCLVTSGLLAAAMLFYWAMTPTHTLFGQAGIQIAPVMELDFSARALAFGISMVPLGALIYGLLNARRCFDAFAAGQIFSSEPIGRLKAFSIAVAASAILKPFTGAALSLFLSFNNSGEVRTVALSIGSDTLIALIFAGTVAVIAWVMTEALDIADENKQFV
ncbi:DUF2975 domain-containing protein [Nitrospirillum iridis]|uniref:DUF2975 domain-containing protein n=1 Tax=Nitrospirillum iridis TaxID=765888 RepID=A0A7X0B1U5_9PROT|nr:DUF2975 domain-containing protein [Nitrospirillum iridis]MBB6254135.1 hypothetical protein [Nitrospirillum iridis]